jgi:hypothetical protein
MNVGLPMSSVALPSPAFGSSQLERTVLLL